MSHDVARPLPGAVELRGIEYDYSNVVIHETVSWAHFALHLIDATVRGGAIVADPRIADMASDQAHER